MIIGILFHNEIKAQIVGGNYYKKKLAEKTVSTAPQTTDSLKPSSLNKEIFELIKQNFIAGNIYFSGNNFPNVVVVRYYEKEFFKSIWQRTGPGSVISFDNCAYKDSAGVIRFVNKSLKFK